MRPIVIVHGAFGGGWEWTPVAEALRAEGLRVFTPTLSGLGERAHIDARSVGLGTHVADIVAVLEMEELEDVLLCAASYAGVPVTAAAPQVVDRIAGLVYLDALVPRDGESAADLLPGWFTASLRDGIRTDGPGYRVPVPSSVLPPVGSASEEVLLSYIARLRPQPVRTLLEPAEVLPMTVPTTFVRSTGSSLGPAAEDPITPMVQRAQEAGWRLSRDHGNA